MKPVSRGAIIAATAFFASFGGAAAQSEQEFVAAFSGQWFAFEPRFSNGSGNCTVILDSAFDGSPGAVTTTGCAAPMSQIAGWRIESGRIVLVDASGSVITGLGGNQRRITGDLNSNGEGIVLERAEGDGSTAALASALSRHRCYYLGFTQSCASASQVSRPELTEENGAYGIVDVLVNLNVRAQPRRDAPSLGTVPSETSIRVNYCLQASDGIWCRAVFGEREGWLAKTAIRRDEWPIVTYVTGLSKTE